MEPDGVHVSVIVFPLTSPESAPVAVHRPPGPDPSNDINPENEPTPAKPLTAPAHSEGTVPHAPSTQSTLPERTRLEMVRVERFGDSIVPVHLPAMFAIVPGVGAGVGDGVAVGPGTGVGAGVGVGTGVGAGD